MKLPEATAIDRIAVMGFGTMGHTWSAALLMAGFDVHVFEAQAAAVEANRPKIRKYLESLSKKGKWSGDVEATLKRLHFVRDEAELAKVGAPIFLEVIFEDFKLKCDTLARMGKLFPAETVFWSNTSCLDVLRMGEASGRPERFIGTHGMNPVHLMVGVEVVRHAKLDPAVLELTNAMIRRMGKEPFVTENVPGFIVNNGLIPWMIHFFNMLERGQATVEDIDKALKTSLGHPQGVFVLTDYVGVNTTILVAEELYKATLDPRYRVPPFVYEMRAAGNDGAKTGRGFYDWTDPKNPKALAFAELTQRQKR